MIFSRWKLISGLAFIALITGAILFEDWFVSDEIELKLRHNDPATVSRGKEVYAANCASCHGADLKGQPNWRVRKENDKLPAPPHDETGHTWHHSDALLITLTKQGPKSIAGPNYKTDMPAYEGVLSDSEIIAVLSYIKSSWPERIRKRHDGLK